MWQEVDGKLVATVRGKDFAEAMAFVNRVAEAAEAASHHPDIDIRWNKVRLVLSTHSQGGLTANDFALAGQIEGLARG